MYDDLKPKKDFEKKLKELKEVLRESRNYINDQQNENATLKKNFNEAFNDAKRYAQKISEIHKRISDENLENVFEDLDLDGLVNE